ncbi:MAG: hypothetical protein EOP10_10675 [Proteobacteria bacterium]|nr:MAG: hypothetical protein EOP10_10675 [Pseudomonadota bacterium]
MQNSLPYRIFFWAHRWFGIVAGLYFVLFGITGSYLVYEATFDRWMYPDRFVSESAADAIDIPRYVATAQAGLQTDRPPLRVTLPESASENVSLIFNLADIGTAPRNVRVYIDPSTFAFKGAYELWESFGVIMRTFHHDLFLGAAVGRFWMGLSGVLFMVILLSGLWIWWPKLRFLKKSLKWPNLRSLYKGAIDLHKFFGIYSLLLMIAVTFSGLYISVPSWFQIGGKPSAPRPPDITSELPEIDFSAIQTQLASHGLLNRPLRVNYNARDQSVTVRLGEGQPGQTYDVVSKTLIADKPHEEGPKPFEMRRFQREVHGGDYWGRLGEILTFTSGLLPLFFWMTGCYVWWTKRRLKAV